MARGLIRILDPEDERIAAFRDVRERDLVGREGLIAEGTVVLDHLIAATRFRPAALLILENRVAGFRHRLERLPDEVPVYVADRRVFDAIAGFPVHRGVLAHGQAVPAQEGEADRLLGAVAARRGIVVAAVGIANHDNMGAIFRNAAAFGAGAVLIDSSSCDPLYRKAIRVSVGSVLSVPFERFDTAGRILERLERARFRCLALSPSGELAVESLRPEGPVALFLGAEGQGLDPALMRKMETVRIGMAPGLDSLNVATSAAIVLHRLYSAASSAA